MLTKFNDTVNESMTSAIPLLLPIASLNTDSNLQQAFFEPKRGGAIAGFRREVANLGALLVRLQYGKDNEVNTMVERTDEGVKLDRRGFEHVNGSYHFVREEYFENDMGLPGMHVDNEHQENIRDAEAVERIDKIRREVEGHYELEISPSSIHSFLKKRSDVLGDFTNRKINIQCTSGTPPVGTGIGKCEIHNGHFVLSVKIPTKKGMRYVSSYVSKNSTISERELELNRSYIVKPDFMDDHKNRYVNVLSRYKRGVRLAVQYLKNGLILPGDPGYDVNPNEQNGIPNVAVANMSFSKTQDLRKIAGAPRLTIDLDMFYQLMHVMSGYNVATMAFKSSGDGIYIRAEGDEYMPHLEAIVGPTYPHIKGKVWLP